MGASPSTPSPKPVPRIVGPDPVELQVYAPVRDPFLATRTTLKTRQQMKLMIQWTTNMRLNGLLSIELVRFAAQNAQRRNPLLKDAFADLLVLAHAAAAASHGPINAPQRRKPREALPGNLVLPRPGGLKVA